jgi:hypothetical protein
MKDDNRQTFRSWDHPLPPEMQAVLDRYKENLKAEQRRKYPHLAALKFPRKERGE